MNGVVGFNLIRFFAVLAMCIAQKSSAAAVRFAVIGDYGVDTSSERKVADLVRTNLNPEFIVTLGDNNYLGAGDTDRAIGKYYHLYIGNYQGSYGAGSETNRFFPALGNHDYFGTYGAHLTYFSLPGNERYYEFERGPVHLFIVNSEINEPDGTSSTSLQARWLSNALARATAPWKLVCLHDPPYSSSAHASTRMRWPFRQWGATAVFGASAHHYERIERDGLTYFVNGAGGASPANFNNPPTQGSLVRYRDNYGAMLVTADEHLLVMSFHSVAAGGTLIDQHAITNMVSGAAPRLVIQRNEDHTLSLSWPAGAGTRLETTTSLENPDSWQGAGVEAISNSTQQSTTIQATNRGEFFRLQRQKSD